MQQSTKPESKKQKEDIPSSRYSRQEILSEIGIRGQEIIQKKIAAIVGLGALGTVAAELLARAGIGKLLLVDRDIVEESNLQRQFLFLERDIGRSKARVAKEKLSEINSSLALEVFAIHLNSGNISLLKEADVFLDCTDNLSARFLLNDFCKKMKIPLVSAAALKATGYVFPVILNGPCLQCFLKEATLETCETAGVLNSISSIIAAQQVTLALQILLGKNGEPFLWHYNTWSSTAKKLIVKKNLACATCKGKYVFLQKKDPVRGIYFCGSNRFQVNGKTVQLDEIRKRWEKIGEVITDGNTLRFKNIFLFADGRALISAKTKEEALSLYSKWVGD